MMAMFRSLSADIGRRIASPEPPDTQGGGVFGSGSTRGRTLGDTVNHGVGASRIDPTVAHFPQDCRHITAIETMCFAASLERELPGLQRDETTTRARFRRRVEACTRR